jgi:hypothetical protein
MIRRAFLVICCALLLGAPLAARAKSSKADPLTGTWTGQIVLADGGASQVSITLELKFDGKEAVTGTISGLPNPGDVKKGTFDPKTGALKLELGRSDGPEVLLVFDGKVEQGTANGRVQGEAGAGEFKLTKKQ